MNWLLQHLPSERNRHLRISLKDIFAAFLLRLSWNACHLLRHFVLGVSLPFIPNYQPLRVPTFILNPVPEDFQSVPATFIALACDHEFEAVRIRALNLMSAHMHSDSEFPDNVRGWFQLEC